MTPVPLLEITRALRLQMKLGRSINHALEEVLRARQDLFSKSLKVWQMKIQAGGHSNQVLKILPELGKNPSRRAFVAILERGLQGSPLDAVLESFEEELFMKIENIFERRLQVLPLKLLVPLTLLVLPGVMGLLLAPLLMLLSGGHL